MLRPMLVTVVLAAAALLSAGSASARRRLNLVRRVRRGRADL